MFVSVIPNFIFSVAEEIIQLSDQVDIRLTLQLIKDISRVFKKLLKHLDGTSNLTSFVLPLAWVVPLLYQS